MYGSDFSGGSHLDFGRAPEGVFVYRHFHPEVMVTEITLPRGEGKRVELAFGGNILVMTEEEAAYLGNRLLTAARAPK